MAKFFYLLVFILEEIIEPKPLFTREEVLSKLMKAEFITNQPELPMAEEIDLDDSEIPESFDSREKWPHCPTIGAIYDQASCGSCWAFCTTEVMSDRICIASNQTIVLSAEDMLTCFKGEYFQGCHGGNTYAALNHWVKQGICTGGPYGSKANCKPYYSFPPWSQKNSTPPCQQYCQDGYKIPYEKDKHYGASAYKLPKSVTAIQKEIMTNGPVTSAFHIYEDFLHYQGKSIYKHTWGKSTGYGHCVKTIGWGVENGTPFWLAVNSWGTNFGKEGVFRILRGTNEVGFESMMATGKPRV